MNPKILQKILEELHKEKPSIDYMKGAVETLMELSGTTPMARQDINTLAVTRTETVSDEEAMLQKYEKGQTGRITN